MTKLAKFDFKKIDFNEDPVQVLYLSHGKRESELPLRKSPVNFSVFRNEGLFFQSLGSKYEQEGRRLYILPRQSRVAKK